MTKLILHNEKMVQLSIGKVLLLQTLEAGKPALIDSAQSRRNRAVKISVVWRKMQCCPVLAWSCVMLRPDQEIQHHHALWILLLVIFRKGMKAARAHWFLSSK